MVKYSTQILAVTWSWRRRGDAASTESTTIASHCIGATGKKENVGRTGQADHAAFYRVHARCQTAAVCFWPEIGGVWSWQRSRLSRTDARAGQDRRGGIRRYDPLVSLNWRERLRTCGAELRFL